MYNVYVNERQLKICDEQQSLTGADLVFRLNGNEPLSFLKKMTQEFEDQSNIHSIILATKNITKTWETFKKGYTLIEAAGGVVFNNENLLLMIYRHQKWDLPKGKIDDGEKKEAAAIREVKEECGLNKVKIIKQLSNTYHTYLLKKEKILKCTYWFEMITEDLELYPQTEEDITEARWMDKKQVKQASTNMYSSILWLLNQHPEVRDKYLID